MTMVAMMAMTAMVDNNSGERRRRRMTTARKIERRITRGKEEGRQQTTMALGKPGKERETKIKKLSLQKKTYFQQYGLSGWSFCSCQKQTPFLLDLSVICCTVRVWY
jgi:hypothetical protein